MEQITIELPTPLINALTAYTEGEQISSSDTIKTALESFLTAKGYLSQPMRLPLEKHPSHLHNTLKFAGNWNDLTDEEFTTFSDEIILRRQQAFIERRNHETLAD